MKKIDIKQAVDFLMQINQGQNTPELYGKKAKRKVMYIAGLALNLPSNGDLIRQSTDKQIGLTNFDGANKLNAGKHLLVVGLRWIFDTTGSVTPTTATWLSAAPANFKNGEMEISQQGGGTLFESPIGPLSGYNAAITPEDQFTAVVPFLIRPGVEFFIKAFLASAAAADQAYRLELDCIEFVDADKA